MAKNHNPKKEKKDDLTIIIDLLNKILRLDQAKIKELKKIEKILKRFSESYNIRQKLAENEEASRLLQQAKETISLLKKLLKQ